MVNTLGKLRVFKVRMLAPYALVRKKIRARLRRWFESRLPRRDTQELTHRNVYILPTRAGWMLLLTLLVLLLASINYQLNLGYLLTFMLAGAAVIGMHVCHGTLRGLRLQCKPPAAQFAGRPTTLEVVLHNPGRKARHGIGLALLDSTRWAWCDVPAQGSQTLTLAHLFTQRGMHAVPTLTAETRYPLGTFRVWTVWCPAAQVLVYPQPELPAPPLPAGTPSGGAQAQSALTTTGEFDGVRAYRRGDARKQIVWKKAAKTDELVSREAITQQQMELWLDYQQAGLGDAEARLARLCAWVLDAEQRGLRYGLRLPRAELPPDSGAAHKARCLELLALFRP